MVGTSIIYPAPVIYRNQGAMNSWRYRWSASERQIIYFLWFVLDKTQRKPPTTDIETMTGDNALIDTMSDLHVLNVSW